MTEDAVLELLEEARQTCGRSASQLAAYLGARVPNGETVARFAIEGYIQRFTGKRVKLPPRDEGDDGVPPPGQCDEKITFEHSAGCDWCRRADTILGGVVACWAADRGLHVCTECATRGVEALAQELCVVCGKPLAIGDWPCITIIRPHGKSVQTTPFVAYFDVALGTQITSLGDRWAAMRPEGSTVHRTADGKEAVSEGRGQLVYRDKMSKGDLSARNDRIHQQLRDRGRGRR